MRTDMAYEEIVVTTPLKRKVKVRMTNLGDDVWDTSLFYANQVRRVGKFKGKGFAIDAAKNPSLLRMKLPAEKYQRKNPLEIPARGSPDGNLICQNLLEVIGAILFL